MRDLDVYLLSRESYEELLPCSLRPGVSEMFDEMEKERNVELKKVKRHLRSKTYKKQMHSLEKFFKEEDNLEASENSLVVIKPFVAKRILKIYGKICEISKDLAQDTPDENIHALRIQCKKMRYMLEFFSHLFDTGGIRILGKSLKSLQDKLGVFNDLSVQQISLLHYIKAKNYRHASPDLYLAVGGMISALHAKYLLQREAVLDGLDEFSCEKNQKLCQKLFKMTEKAK
jgi:CHAD domain-containing protein